MPTVPFLKASRNKLGFEGNEKKDFIPVLPTLMIDFGVLREAFQSLRAPTLVDVVMKLPDILSIHLT